MASKDGKSQIDKFREAAAALGVDVSDADHDAAVAKVAKAPKLTDDQIKALAKKHRASGKE